MSDWPYNLSSIRKRFGKLGSKPPKRLKDGSFSRAAAGFMGQSWDTDIAYNPTMWDLVMPLLKEQAFTVGFSHQSMSHKLATAQEESGFLIAPSFVNYASGQTLDIPAQLGWIYGSGKPSGTDISKGIDKAAGAERGKRRIETNGTMLNFGGANRRPWKDRAAECGYIDVDDDQPVTEMAKIWNGYQYGNPLSPEIEPIIIGQKPWVGHRRDGIAESGAGCWNIGFGQSQKVGGRYPGTLVLEHHPGCQLVGYKPFDNPNGSVSGNEPSAVHKNTYGSLKQRTFYRSADTEMIPDYDCHPDCHVRRSFGDGEEKQRYFYESDWSYEIMEMLATIDPIEYCPKPTAKERDLGLNHLPKQVRQRVNPGGLQHEPRFANTMKHNNHPTLKPIKLCKWLAGLLLPPPEYAPRRILVPCSGTGSEIIGALLAGWDEVIGVEITPAYSAIAHERVAYWHEWIQYGQRDVDAILASTLYEEQSPGEPEQLSFI